MKFRKIMLGALSALMITAGFTACDDEDWDPIKEGSTIEMVQTRAFILNEGNYGDNNAGITYFDWMTDNTYNSDLYMAQNKKALGDTGQDIIVEDGNIYVILSNSKSIVKLNSVGVEKVRISVPADLGDPRYMVEENGYLYVDAEVCMDNIYCRGGKIKRKNERFRLVLRKSASAETDYGFSIHSINCRSCGGMSLTFPLITLLPSL